MPKLLALSVHLPWSYLIVKGWKDIENRTWQPPPSVIGTVIAIHATKRMPSTQVIRFIQEHIKAWRDSFGRLGLSEPLLKGELTIPTLPELDRMRGAILGTVRVTGWGKDMFKNPWYEGPVAWTQREARALMTPIPCKGKQGLWQVPGEIAEEVLKGGLA